MSFKAIATKCFSPCIGWIASLQLIILPSLTLKPAKATHLWIVEDLVYISVLQAFRFDQSCSCSKGVFGIISMYHTEFLNTKWWQHMILPTLNSSYSKTY